MRGKLGRVIDRTLFYYLLIGILNFLCCNALMFLLFNLCGFSEHVAPLFNYSLGSINWYLSCKYILFRGHKTSWKQLARFVTDVLCCYFLAYYIVAPLLSAVLLHSELVRSFFSFGGKSAEKISGNCQMAIGAVTYALSNYVGQRYFVFSDRFEHLRRKQNGIAEEKDN